MLAPHAAGRQQNVPGAAAPREATPAVAAGPWRLPWARLLARVFRLHVSRCPTCGGPMRIIAALTDPDPIRTYLDGVGLDSRPPPIAPPEPAVAVPPVQPAS